MIQNWDEFRKSLWNWRPLAPCFPRGIEPTDIDGFVELGGYFLVLEGKASGVPLKEGQLRTFQRMYRWNKTVPNLFTIIVIWGAAHKEQIDQLQFWPNQPFKAGWPQLRSYVKAWADNVEHETTNEFAATREQRVPKPRPSCKHNAEYIIDGVCWICDHMGLNATR